MLKKQSFPLSILTGCLIIFIICTILAVSKTIQPWEGQLLHLIYSLPTGLYWPFYILTISGSILTIGTITLVLTIRNNLLLARYVCILAFLTAGSVEIIKNIVMRPRPYLLLSDIPLRAFYVRGYGFPSGHTAVAAAVATSLWSYTPRSYRPLLILWVLLVGLSRMYLGVHAPLDVTGGATLGCGITIFVKLLFANKLPKGDKSKHEGHLPN